MKHRNLTGGILASALTIAGLTAYGGGQYLRQTTPGLRKPPMRLMTDEPRGHFGVGVVSYSGITLTTQGYWGELEASTGIVEKKYTGEVYGAGMDYDLQSGAVRDGILYLPKVKETLEDVEIMWARVDLETGRQLTPISFGANWSAYGYSMTYDPNSDLFHILSLDYASGSYGIYATVDPNGWKLKVINQLSTSEFLGGIAYNPADGQVWVFSSKNQAYTIDPDSAMLVEVGSFDSDYRLVQDYTTAAVTYSPLDGSFVFFWPDGNSEVTRLVYLDPETLGIDEGYELSPDIPYIGYIHSFDQYAEADAPSEPRFDEISFENGSLSGRVSFTVPTETFDANNLRGTVTMTLTDNGELLRRQDTQPGERVSYELTLTEGLHTLSLQAEAGGLKSAVVKRNLYVGHDAPVAPGNLTISGTTVSWDAVGPKGENNGFVDTSAIRYNVYLDGELQTQAPIAETSYNLTVEGEQSRRKINVEATAGGKTSEKAVLSAVLGEAAPLPWSMAPTDSEQELFTIVNTNGGKTFGYNYDWDLGRRIFELWLDMGENADDWVFLPKSHFATADEIYEVAFQISSAAVYEGTEYVEVYLGNNPTPEAMTKVIYSNKNMECTSAELLKIPFAISESGDYVVGIHCHTRANQGYGLRLYDFSMKSTGRSSAVPAEPAEIEFEAAERGGLSAAVRLKAGEEDLTGNPLPKTEPVTFLIAEVGGEGHTTELTALPGEEVSGSIAVTTSGMTTFRITPCNRNGEGLTTTRQKYVGVDTPLAPKNIRGVASDDNMSLTVSWDAPEAVGRNGGYVDVEDLEYVIYVVDGVTYNEIETLPASSRSYTYTPALRKQNHLIIGPAARNSVGESHGSDFWGENIGTPYAAPLTEKFSSNGFTISPVMYSMTAGFENSAWEPISSIMGQETGALNDVQNGGLIVYNTGSRPTCGELVLPKFSTSELDAGTFTLRWLDWAHTPSFSLWGRCNGSTELRCLGEFIPERPAAGKWVDSKVSLPEEFCNNSWVEFRVRAELTTDIKEYGYIDVVSITQDVDRDLKVSAIETPVSLTVGEVGEGSITAMNAGTETVSGSLEITLSDTDGNVYLTESHQIVRLAPMQIYSVYVNIECLREYLDGGEILLSARTICEDDRLQNNDRMTASIAVEPSQVPAVGDLTASWSGEGDAALLRWSSPNLEYGDGDGFELLTPFAVEEEMGIWLNYDRDGGYPFRITGLNWDNNDCPIGWQTIDAEAIGVLGDSRLGPHTGRQYLMARSISFDEDAGEDPIQSNDWLISPEVVGGTRLEFWYGTIDPELTEYVELWVSATDRNIESFRKVRSFSKEGSEAWENVRYTLPADTRYFALVYKSYDSFGAMLDDISFTPAQLSRWEIDHYAVVRQLDTDRAAQEIATTSEREYLDETVNGRSASYRVVTAVKNYNGVCYGPASNTARIEGSGVDDMRLLSGVRGGKGCIVVSGLEGETLALYGTDGKFMTLLNVSSSNQSFAADGGIYMVKCGNRYAKVIVK